MENRGPDVCMSQACPTKAQTVYGIRIDFRYSARGARPKVHVAYLELYVCAACATEAAAQEMYNDHTQALGLQIGGAIGGKLDWENTVVSWVPKMECEALFHRVDKTIAAHEAKEAEARRVSIVDAANDTVQ